MIEAIIIGLVLFRTAFLRFAICVFKISDNHNKIEHYSSKTMINTTLQSK